MHLQRKQQLIALALLITTSAAMSGCAGRVVREKALVPFSAVMNDEFRANVDLGVGVLEGQSRTRAEVTVENFFTAVQSKDTESIVHGAWPAWPVVKGYALAGIDHRRSLYSANTDDPDGMPVSAMPIAVGEIEDIEDVLLKFVTENTKGN